MSLESIEIRYTQIVRELELLRGEAAACALAFDRKGMEAIAATLQEVADCLNLPE